MFIVSGRLNPGHVGKTYEDLEVGDLIQIAEMEYEQVIFRGLNNSPEESDADIVLLSGGGYMVFPHNETPLRTVQVLSMIREI